MEVKNLSLEGKKKFAKWIGERYRKLSVAELVKNCRDEVQLFAMCEYIDKWYNEHEGPVKETPQERLSAYLALRKRSRDTQEASATPKMTVQVPGKHVHLKQYDFSRRVNSRLNDFMMQHPDVSITRMLSDAANEDELMKAMDEFENRVITVDPRVKIWTVRVPEKL